MLIFGFIELAQLFPVLMFPNPFEIFNSTIYCTSSTWAESEIMYRSTFNDISTFPALYFIHSDYLFLHKLLFTIVFFQSSYSNQRVDRSLQERLCFTVVSIILCNVTTIRSGSIRLYHPHIAATTSKNDPGKIFFRIAAFVYCNSSLSIPND